MSDDKLAQARENAKVGCSQSREMHCVTCAGRRTASPISPNLSFRHTQVALPKLSPSTTDVREVSEAMKPIPIAISSKVLEVQPTNAAA
jgi:hypothetical protein